MDYRDERDALRTRPEALEPDLVAARDCADGKDKAEQALASRRNSRRSLDDLLASYDATLPLEEAWALPAPFYVDEAVFDREREQVIGATWQLVGRADQLASSGQFITTEISGEPIVVVRGRDGVLRGFFNVCRHHAAAVVSAAEGTLERLRCPYHGWTYGLDGALRSTTEMEGARHFPMAESGLRSVRVAEWNRFVFAHLDPDPPSFEASFGAGFLASFTSLSLGDLTFAGRREWTLDCNWKVFVDNYLDGGYHVPFLHRNLGSVISFTEYRIECFERACLQSSPIEPTGGEPTTAAVRKGFAWYGWLYPNLMLNAYEGHLDTNLVVPISIDKTRVIFDFYLPSTMALEERERSIVVSERVQEEDLEICASVQRGLGSRAYRSGRLSPRREAGEHLFHKLLVSDLRSDPKPMDQGKPATG